MSSIRAAAVLSRILVKVGRHRCSLQSSNSHTASWWARMMLSDAAVRRAGVVRVQTITQLFPAATGPLSCGFHPAGNRLAIVTNGGGPGVMATDHAADLDWSWPPYQIPPLKTHQVLPPTCTRQPVDIIGMPRLNRYHHAVKAVWKSRCRWRA